ncbi:energy-coupling factor ABC transporter substrate-binding protein [Clostridium formicaceticum]|uniref:Cobalt transport protein CbiN n=1 Tax=Clostridium formicaceticum TaxID=1497 RepID=A0AAC9RK50_9CLOT|nr:cobalt transport protein CbiN [Clostridium formicaceticum]AOY76130.1 hypothetical protein BJL90_09585 [Clostridium formicaceticum]ARE86498.1 Cobalt transport protein CbiN [Clostridium formicaceticum]
MNNNRKNPFPSIIVMLLLVGILVVTPLLLHKGGEFEGADDLAGEAIEELAPEYEAWFEPIFEPSTDVMEKILFTLQAVCGGGVILYTLQSMKKTPKREGI